MLDNLITRALGSESESTELLGNNVLTRYSRIIDHTSTPKRFTFTQGNLQTDHTTTNGIPIIGLLNFFFF